jgi:hypothetical protein
VKTLTFFLSQQAGDRRPTIFSQTPSKFNNKDSINGISKKIINLYTHVYLHEYGILGCKIFSVVTSGVGAVGSIKEFPGGSCSTI